MSAKCHVCGRGKPINPSVRFPICGACKRSVWEREQHTPDELKTMLERKLDDIAGEVVAARRIKAAMSGLDALQPYHPLPRLEILTPPKT